MPGDVKDALAAALAEQSPDDDDLRDWLTDRAEFVLDALAAAGFHVCRDGEAVVCGSVVPLSDPWEKVRSFGLDAPTSTWVWQASKKTPLGVHPDAIGKDTNAG